MQYVITCIFTVSCTLSAFAQPELNSWMLNTTGATASYNDGMGTVTLSDSVNVLQVCYNTTHVYVRSEGLRVNYTEFLLK
ncbi:MAG TPA: hypothetical protein EYN71_04175 [Flavobacteriales bacterium]|nr:hypothetical protein [Flavobacteriales bacterium]HIO67608.1 hypothetical protein [Flavobacteriales bacterium]